MHDLSFSIFFILSELDWEVKKIVITNLLEKTAGLHAKPGGPATRVWPFLATVLILFLNRLLHIPHQKYFWIENFFIGLDYKINYFHYTVVRNLEKAQLKLPHLHLSSYALVRYFSILAIVSNLDWQE